MHGGCNYFAVQVHYFIWQCNINSAPVARRLTANMDAVVSTHHLQTKIVSQFYHIQFCKILLIVCRTRSSKVDGEGAEQEEEPSRQRRRFDDAPEIKGYLAALKRKQMLLRQDRYVCVCVCVRIMDTS